MASAAQLQYQCHAFSSCPSSLTRSCVVRTSLPQHLLSGKHVDSTASVKIGLSGTATDDEDDRSRPNIVVIKTHEDYVNFLEEDDRLCVVKFYATWCKSCQRFGLKYRHLARDEGDHIIGTEAEDSIAVTHTGEVRFAEIEYASSAKLCKTLKVKKLPTVHMYRKGKGKLADMTCKPSLFHLVVDELHRLMEDPEAETSVVEVKLKGTLKKGPDVESSKLAPEIETNNVRNDGNVTSTSFDSLANEIKPFLGKKGEKVEAKKEKSPWFPFTF